MGGKRAWRRAVRLAEVTGSCWYKGQLLTRPMVAYYAKHIMDSTNPMFTDVPSDSPRPTRSRRPRPNHTMKVWSYNTESLICMDRLGELLRHARDRCIAIVCFQSTLMGATTPWTSAGFRIIPTPRTSTRAKDGCATALNLKFFDQLEVRCIHEWLPGRLLGIRVRRAGARERDLLHSEWLCANQYSQHSRCSSRQSTSTGRTSPSTGTFLAHV